jgi:molecular chaperone DnaK
MTPLIERNTTIPVRKSETFTTAADGQTVVTIHVLQGERPMAADNISLGQFNLEGIPPAPRGVPQVEVTFDIDANGILNVSAQDKATGKEQQITITATTNLDENEVDELLRKAKQHEAEDKQRKELIEARNNADSLIYQTEKFLNELGDKVTGSDRSSIEDTISKLKEAMEAEDVSRIRQLTEELKNANMALGQQMYAQQQAAGGPTPGGPTAGGPGGGPTPGGAAGPQGGPSGGDEGDVIEGEFSEA